MQDFATTRIYRELPVYIQITEALRHDIIKGELPPHSRLPSELELMRKFGVARATIRRALAKLQDDGLTYSRRAVGSFVAEPKVDQDLDQLFSFTEFMAYRGMKPGSQLLDAEIQQVTSVNSPLLVALRLSVGEKVIFIRRLRTSNGQPMVIATTFLPKRLFPDFLARDIEDKSVYEIMDESYGLKPDDASQTFEAVMLGDDEAQLLTVLSPAPALLITRTGYAKGAPVEYALDYYRGDRTKFRARLGAINQTPLVEADRIRTLGER
ncbi:MAG TPA: GntR family transcriptional regulator [Pyrinomonadaceae bacterium]|nr:GntR family transcriptional regulator [Pyrinomonadaceae bacterium]